MFLDTHRQSQRHSEAFRTNLKDACTRYAHTNTQASPDMSWGFLAPPGRRTDMAAGTENRNLVLLRRQDGWKRPGKTRPDKDAVTCSPRCDLYPSCA